MSSSKKDLTRIEELGEFFHEETEETVEVEEIVPETPVNEVESSFLSSDENEIMFEASETFETSDFETEDAVETKDQEFETDELNSIFPETPPPVEIEEEATEATEEKSDFSSSISFEETPPQDISSSDISPKWEAEPPLFDASENYEEIVTSSPENFEELKKFSEASSFSGMATEGNPSFSVLIKNVRYIEDINDILSLLKEFDLLVDSEEQMKSRLMRGILLVPRISEFAAILLAHKLRRYDIDIEVGPSEQIHPSKHLEKPETGIVSKHNLYQNQSHHFEFQDVKLELSQIIIAATPMIEGYQILRYFGIASEHKILEGHDIESENSLEVSEHYNLVAQKLKAHALKVNANAVVGINYQLTPIPSEYGATHNKYRLTCSGNLVWAQRL